MSGICSLNTQYTTYLCDFASSLLFWYLNLIYFIAIVTILLVPLTILGLIIADPYEDDDC